MNLTQPELSIAHTLSSFNAIKTGEALEVSTDSRLTEITIAIEAANNTSLSLEYEYSDMRSIGGSAKGCILLRDLLKENCATQCGTTLYVTFDLNSDSSSINVRKNAQDYHQKLFADGRYIDANPLNSIKDISLTKIDKAIEADKFQSEQSDQMRKKYSRALSNSISTMKRQNFFGRWLHRLSRMKFINRQRNRVQPVSGYEFGKRVKANKPLGINESFNEQTDQLKRKTAVRREPEVNIQQTSLPTTNAAPPMICGCGDINCSPLAVDQSNLDY